MCWSATASFVTLGVGTILNVASYALLVRRNSPTSMLVWSWQYALLMQIPEGIAWLQLDAHTTHADADVRVVSRVAMILNITQPLALLAGIRTGGLYREFRYAYVALAMYAVVLATQANEIWPAAASIAPEDGCAHLDLRYWDASRGIVYVATSLFIVSEARPIFWALVNAGIFLTSLGFAMFLYPCGVGSVWCWFIFLAGPILLAADVMRGFAVVTPIAAISDVRVVEVPSCNRNRRVTFAALSDTSRR